jgi:acetolactate synthase-1/2/3 large subunit
LVVVGSELGDSDLWAGSVSGGTVIRIDIEAGQLQKNCRADITLLADAAEALWAVLTALPTDRPQAADGPDRAARLRAECRAEARTDAGSYEAINGAVRAALPADGVLTGDSSQVTYFGSVHFFDVPGPRQFCYTPGYATLGYGLPAGIGASLSRPGTPVATLLGDGAFMFSVQELATAVELRLPLPIVVVDNGGYREIRDQETSRGIPPVGVDLQVPDLALLATAVGAHGVRTKDPAALTGLVQDALGADRPTVIHLDWTE